MRAAGTEGWGKGTRATGHGLPDGARFGSGEGREREIIPHPPFPIPYASASSATVSVSAPSGAFSETTLTVTSAVRSAARRTTAV